MRGCSVAFAVVLAWGSLHAQGSLDVSLAARAIAPGEVVVVTTRTSTPADGIAVHLLDRRIPVFRTDDLTWTAVAGIDLDATPGDHTVSVEATGSLGPQQKTVPFTIAPGRFTTRRLRVDPVFVEPPPEVVSRILSEADRLEQLWTRAGDRQWSGPFVPPVAGRPVGRFGARSIFNGQLRAPHAGEDYARPVGTPVVAPGGGTVTLAEPLYFTGNTVVVDHGAGLFSIFAHLSAMSVGVGDIVTTGGPIGTVGATGRVTGPHLHWSVRLGGARVSPSSLLAALGPAPSARGTARRLPR